MKEYNQNTQTTQITQNPKNPNQFNHNEKLFTSKQKEIFWVECKDCGYEENYFRSEYEIADECKCGGIITPKIKNSKINKGK